MSEVKAAKRLHRRLEAMLMHPLSHLVINDLNRPGMEAARDVLRESLGYSESLAEALGQQTVDDEIRVRLQDDGTYAFGFQPDFVDDEAPHSDFEWTALKEGKPELILGQVVKGEESA